MSSHFRSVIAFILIALISSVGAEPVNHTFDFGYEAVFEGLKPGSQARMWAPLPQGTKVQKWGRLRMSPPLRAKISEDRVGNRYLFMEGEIPKRGSLKVKVQATIQRTDWNPEKDEVEDVVLSVGTIELDPPIGSGEVKDFRKPILEIDGEVVESTDFRAFSSPSVRTPSRRL